MPENDGTSAEQIKQDLERYHKAMHGVQSAIAFEISSVGDAAAGATHKHLRVGVNACLVDSSALSQLLIAKGAFTEAEYIAAIAAAAERELATLTDRARKRSGVPNLTFA